MKKQIQLTESALKGMIQEQLVKTITENLVEAVVKRVVENLKETSLYTDDPYHAAEYRNTDMPHDFRHEDGNEDDYTRTLDDQEYDSYVDYEQRQDRKYGDPPKWIKDAEMEAMWKSMQQQRDKAYDSFSLDDFGKDNPRLFSRSRTKYPGARAMYTLRNGEDADYFNESVKEKIKEGLKKIFENGRDTSEYSYEDYPEYKQAQMQSDWEDLDKANDMLGKDLDAQMQDDGVA